MLARARANNVKIDRAGVLTQADGVAGVKREAI